MIPIYVLSNQKHHWLLPGFCHMFRTFWGVNQPVTIASFGEPDSVINSLPAQFDYMSLGEFNLPAALWSNGLMKLCYEIEHKHFILMLEDYWLTKQVDKAFIKDLFLYAETMDEWEDLLRIDLTADRSSRRSSQTWVSQIPGMIISPRRAKYQMSFQAGIWHRKNLLWVLRRDESPWESELDGSTRLKQDRLYARLIVLGTIRQPLKYIPAYRANQRVFYASKLPPKHIAFMKNKGMIQLPKGVKWA